MRRIRAICALVVVTTALAACNSKKDEFTPTPLPQADRKVSAIFVEASTGLPVTAQLDVDIRDSAGAPATVSQDANGRALNHLSVQNGVAVFQVSPTATLPVTLQVVATAPGGGFDPAVARVIVAGNGTFETTARMLNRALPPTGAVVAARPVGTATATGETTGDVTATTPATSTAPAVSITVPAATTLRDVSGQPLTGALTAKLTSYDVQQPAALALLPDQGQAVVTTQNGAQESGQFVTAGFASVEITDESGRRASTSSAPMPIRINVAPVVDPVTGAAVGPGSTIPFWSYSTTSGAWKDEGSGSVGVDATSKLFAELAPSHLTVFTAGYLDKRTCTTPSTIVANGNPNKARLTALVTLVGGGFARTYTAASDAVSFKLADAIPQRAARVSIQLDGTEVGSTTVQDPCAGVQVPVVVNVPTVQAGTLQFHVVRVCDDDPTRRFEDVGNAATVVVVPQVTGAVPVSSSTVNGSAAFPGLRIGGAYSYLVSLFGSSNSKGANVVFDGDGKLVEVQVPVACNATGATGN